MEVADELAILPKAVSDKTMVVPRADGGVGVERA